MSDNEKRDLTENDCESDDEQVKILVETATLDKTVQESHGSSKIRNPNLQQSTAEGTEIDPNDVIIVEQLSHESIGESSSENLDCKVTYEFPSEDESEKASFSGGKESKVSYEYLNGQKSESVSSFSAACVVPSHKIPQVSDHAGYRPVPLIAEQSKDEQIKIPNPKSLNKDSLDNRYTAGTSAESERKRKKASITLLQSKRHKETESSTPPVTHGACDSVDIQHDENSDLSSDGFADIEDNVKDSSSSENSDANATTETAKQIQTKNQDGRIMQRKKGKDESLDKNKTLQVNNEASSSNLHNPPTNKSLDKAAKKSPFPSSLKGETVPVIRLSDDMKKKFEIPMPTILEVRESESDEQILQPKKSNSNPLIIKTSVVKRKDRCNICNVRLGLCAIKCRCGGYYCAKHRYDKEHNCTFDYKSMGAEEIERNNPKIIAEKVRKL